MERERRRTQHASATARGARGALSPLRARRAALHAAVGAVLAAAMLHGASRTLPPHLPPAPAADVVAPPAHERAGRAHDGAALPTALEPCATGASFLGFQLPVAHACSARSATPNTISTDCTESNLKGHTCTRGSSNSKYWATGSQSQYERRTFGDSNWVSTLGPDMSDPMFVYARPWFEYCCTSGYFQRNSEDLNTGVSTYYSDSTYHIGRRAYFKMKFLYRQPDDIVGALGVDRNAGWAWDGVPTTKMSRDFYFELPSGGGEFFLDLRFEIQNSGGGWQGVINWFDGEGFGGGHKSSGCGGRTITTFDMEIIKKKCPPGQYQIGDECTWCPEDTFNVYKNQVVRGGDIDAICLPCTCAECETCQAPDGSCPVTPGRCNIDGVCYTENDLRVSETWPLGDPCVQCRYDVADRLWTGVSGNSCDDRELCTRDDTCSEGVCFGTPFTCLNKAHTGNDWEDCEVCNGYDCDLKADWTGCRKDGKCGCVIDGVCYSHGEKNPDNECYVCDVVRHRNAWVVALPVPCNDGDLCTHTDTCIDGVCIGTDYACPTAGADCLEDNTCDGTGECIETYTEAGTECAAELDECTPAVQCTGDLAVCPAQVTLSPVVSMGAIDIVDGPRTDYAVPPAWEGSQFALARSDSISAALREFGVECGDFALRWGFFRGDDASSCRADGADATIGGGYTQWEEVSDEDLHASALNVTRGGLQLHQGFAYRVIVQTRNDRLEVLTDCSPPVVVDVTPPDAGVVVDRDPRTSSFMDADLDTNYHHQPTLEVLWSAFGDAQTSWNGFLRYEWAVGTVPGDDDVVAWTVLADPAAELAAYASAPGDGPLSYTVVTSAMTDEAETELVPGLTYYASVRATNRAHSSTTVSSNGVAVDFTPPVVESLAVFDGPGTGWLSNSSLVTSAGDEDGQSHTAIEAHWGVYDDPESPLDHFEVAVGTAPYGSQKLAFTNVGTATQFYSDKLGLFEGVRYFTTIRAWNRAGLYSDASSDGVWVDRSPPKLGVVRDLIATDAAFAAALEGPASNFKNDARTMDVAFTVSTDSLRVAHEWTEEESFVLFGEAQVRAVAGDGSDDGVVRDWTRIPAGEGSVTGLDLDDGRRYRVCVRATNAAKLVSPIVCSDGVTVDATPPTAFTVADVDEASGDLEDVQFHSMARLIAMWSAATDDGSGLRRYVVKVTRAPIMGPEGLTSNASDRVLVRDWSSRGLDTQTVVDGVPGASPDAGIAYGYAYFITVRAINNAFAYSEVVSNGVISDVTPPPTGLVADGLVVGVDLAWLPSETEAMASWTGFEDPESGIDHFEWAVGACEGGETSVMDFVDVGDAVFATAPDLELALGVEYCVSVRAFNGVGMVTLAASDGAAIDPSPPSVGFVNDVTGEPGADGTDIDFQLSNEVLHAAWFDFEDPQSGVTYEVSVGTAPYLQDVMPWTASGSGGTDTTMAMSGLDLDGSTVYTTVRARNGAGKPVMAVSDGVTVDTTPPEAGTFRYGLDTWQSVRYQPTTSLSANWDGFSDSGAWVTDFSWRLGTAVGLDDVVGDTSVSHAGGLATELRPEDTEGIVTLTPGVDYFMSLTVTNAAGLSLLYEHPDPITADVTAPECGDIVVADVDVNDLDGAESDGSVQHVIYWWSDRFVDVHFRGFSEPESAASLDLRYVIGGKADDFGAQYSVTETGLGTVVRARLGSLHLSNGGTYHVSVRAVNGAGLYCHAISEPFVVSSVPPAPFDVFDGPVPSGFTGVPPEDGGVGGADERVSEDHNRLRAHWFTSAAGHAGLSRYEVAFGSFAGGTDVQGWASLPASAVEAAEVPHEAIAPLPDGVYFAVVRAVSRSRLTTTALTDGVVIDASEPEAGTVYDIRPRSEGAPLFDDRDFQVSDSAWRMSWRDFEEPHSSITHYVVSVGSLPGKDDVVTWTNVGLEDSWASDEGVTPVDLNVTKGATYFSNVRAYNAAGLYAEASSNGRTIVKDHDMPVQGAVVITQSDRSTPAVFITAPDEAVAADEGVSLYAAWSGFSDSVAGIDQFFVAVGMTPGGSEVMGFAAVDLGGGSGGDAEGDGSATSWGAGGFVLDQGAEAYVTVKAVSGSDRFVSAVSAPVRVDFTAPTGFIVVDGPEPMVDDVKGGDEDAEWPDPVTDAAMAEDPTVIIARWGNATDVESDIVRYEVGVGLEANPDVGSAAEDGVFAWQDVGLANTFTSTPTALLPGRYFTSVRAYNGAGLFTTHRSNGIVVDPTPPELGARVFDGQVTGVQASFLARGDELSANWEPFVERESAVARYEIAFGTGLGVGLADNIMPWTDVGLELSFAAFNGTRVVNQDGTEGPEIRLTRPLEPGERAFASVRATNVGGLSTEAYSPGVVVDNTPPLNATIDYVHDAFWWDQEVGASTEHWVNVSWSDFFDPESGVVEYRVSLGTKPGTANIVSGWRPGDGVDDGDALPNSTRTMIGPISMSIETRAYVSVTAVNGAGLATTAHAAEWLEMDVTPPEPFEVFDGYEGPDVWLQPDKYTVAAHWNHTEDPQSGPITHYELACGNGPNGKELFGWLDMGLETQYTTSMGPLRGHVTYVCSVRAYNSAGARRTSFSNGFRADDDAPIVQEVRDGWEVADIDYQRDTTRLLASWVPFFEPDSDVVTYEVCAGTQPGLDDIVGGAWRDVGMTDRAEFVMHELAPLEPGATYYVSVRAKNVFNMWSEVGSSDGITIDITPPAGEHASVSASLGDPRGNTVALPTLDGCECDVDEVFDPLMNACVCPAHHYRGALSRCLPCPLNSVKPWRGDSACMVCPAGSSEDGLPPGFAAPTGALALLDSDAGTGAGVDYSRVRAFKDDPAARHCICHSEGMVVTSGFSACVCDAGWTLESPLHPDSACVPCNTDAGEYKPEIGNGACLHCPEGTVPNADGTSCLCAGEADELPGARVFDVRNANCVCAPGWGTSYNSTQADALAVELAVPVAELPCDFKCPAGTFKTGLGDHLNSCAQCPTDSESSADGTSCECNDPTAMFDASQRRCVCPVGLIHDVLPSGDNGNCTAHCGGNSLMWRYNGLPGDGCEVCPERAGASYEVSTLRTLFVEWGGFVDDGEVVRYWLSVGTSPGGSQAMAPRDMGTGTFTIINDIDFSPSVPLYVAVVAEDAVGLRTAVGAPYVLMVDVSPPTIGESVGGEGTGAVWDGAATVDDATGALLVYGPAVDAANAITSDATTATGHWTQFVDPESGVAEVAVGLGTSPNTFDVAGPFAHESTVAQATITGLSLQSGVRYYFVVAARSNAGRGSRVGVASSDGFVVDTTPPVLGHVYDGTTPRQDADCQPGASGTGIAASWDGFSDDESGIARYEWAIGTAPLLYDLMPWADVGTQQSALNIDMVVPQRVQLGYNVTRRRAEIEWRSHCTNDTDVIDDDAGSGSGSGSGSGNGSGDGLGSGSGDGEFDEWGVNATASNETVPSNATLPLGDGSSNSTDQLDLYNNNTDVNATDLWNATDVNATDVLNVTLVVDGGNMTDANATDANANATAASVAAADLCASPLAPLGTPLEEGMVVFVSVRATNGVGLSSTAASDGVKLLCANGSCEGPDANFMCVALGSGIGSGPPSASVVIR